jgi:hypothetical protein
MGVSLYKRVRDVLAIVNCSCPPDSMSPDQYEFLRGSQIAKHEFVDIHP